jgi:hypothetical protein
MMCAAISAAQSAAGHRVSPEACATRLSVVRQVVFDGLLDIYRAMAAVLHYI